MNRNADLEAKLRLFDAAPPLEHARTIPALWYTDAAIADLERSAVFGATWQCVGRADQVTKPGDFFTADVAGEPLLVVRGDDNELRAFANVCRHRAARVACESEGCATKFRCRYHGWTYDLQGRLRGVPEFDGVADFRREDHGLPQYAVATWGPLVFVHLDPSPAPLQEFLNPLPERTINLGIEALRFVERRVYELGCNWKVFVDNYLDGGYHVHTIHPSLAGVLDYSGYHTVNYGNTSVQISPMRQPDAAREDASAASVRQGDNAYYWWLFPNLMINLYAGVMDTNLVLPLGPDRCRVIFDFYFAETSAEFSRQSMAVGHQIQLEDVDICENVQRGLKSRSFSTGRYSVRRESGVHHFHRLLAERLAAGGKE
jgi:choline monooxygenase